MTVLRPAWAHPYNESHQAKWLDAVRFLRARFGSFPCPRPLITTSTPVEHAPPFADRVRPIIRSIRP